MKATAKNINTLPNGLHAVGDSLYVRVRENQNCELFLGVCGRLGSIISS